MASAASQGNGQHSQKQKELLVRMVDRLAAEQPDTVYAKYPIASDTYDAGFREITYSHFANAVNGIAWWLTNQLGGTGNFDTLTYIGPNDFRYPALILGANKASYKVLLASPRNGITAQWHLLKALNCRVLLTPNPRPPPISAILDAQEYELNVLEVPTVDELLTKAYEHFPYDKTFEEARKDPFVALHTSGTTGIPKPIVWPQDYPSSLGRQVQLDPPAGYESNDRLYSGNRVFIFFPPFHAAFHAHALVNAITNLTCVIFPLPAAIPSAHGLSSGLKQTKADAAFVVPSMVEEMSKDPSLLDHISNNLNVLVYAGGDVPQGCGDKVTTKLKLINYYGATEIGSVAIIRPQGPWQTENWKYLTFHPDIGMDLRPYADGIHELYIVRDNRLIEHQPTFTLFPELQEYRTRDLWTRHPTKPNSWSHCGRADDIVVFLTGEKTNPTSMEQHIFASNPDVNAVLVAGSLRFQAALLIEPKGDNELSPTERAQYLDRIWPSIEEANLESPAHARIARSHVLFTKPGKRMQRTPKGTIQRRQTLETYAKALDDLYRDADSMATIDSATKSLQLDDTRELKDLIKSAVLQASGVDLQDDENIVEKGVDSLQALTITRELRRTLGIKDLSVSLVYANPYVAHLAQAIQHFAESQQKSLQSEAEARKAAISRLLAHYQLKLDEIPRSQAKLNITDGSDNHRVVMLTGSTGAFGSFILHALLNDSSITHIYCLNRSADSSSVQRDRSKQFGLNSSDFADRVTFLQADFADPKLGLSASDYGTLLQRLTTIIHSAWPVNFNRNIDSFVPQLTGVVHLAKLVASSHLRPKLFFVSSISSVYSLSGLVKEAIVLSDDAPSPSGYAESKYISERLLAQASERLGMPVCIARVGQIAGPANGPGLWNPREWFPSLVVSSAHLRALPGSLPLNLNVVDWLPVDHLASIAVRLAVDGKPIANGQNATNNESAEQTASTQVVHLLNPHTLSWSDIVPAILSIINSSQEMHDAERAAPVKVVPFAEWLRYVRNDLEGAANSDVKLDRSAGGEGEALERVLERNPAAKLLAFFEQQAEVKARAELQTTLTEQLSPELGRLGAIRGEWMEKWVRGWLG